MQATETESLIPIELVGGPLDGGRSQVPYPPPEYLPMIDDTPGEENPRTFCRYRRGRSVLRGGQPVVVYHSA